MQLQQVEVMLWVALGLLFFVVILLGFLLEGARKDRKERHGEIWRDVPIKGGARWWPPESYDPPEK